MLSLEDLQTPCLLLDTDVLERNIETMAEEARRRGVTLRPHAKTHKCVEIARLQVAAGAVGVCCARLDEISAMAAAGIENLLLTSPVVGSAKLARLEALLTAGASVLCVAESPEAAADLGVVAVRAGQRLRVLVDVDAGHGRSGATSPETAVATARAIAAHDALVYEGMQSYAGHVQHVISFEERKEAAEEAGLSVVAAMMALIEAGFPPKVITGSGTGTFSIDAPGSVFNELQCGSYAVMDGEYLSLEGEDEPEFLPALHVLTTVIADGGRKHVTVDAGGKSLSGGFVPPRPVGPDGFRGSYSPMGDEHGAVVPAPGKRRPRVGERLLIIPAHCDPTIALHPALYVHRNWKLEGCWRVCRPPFPEGE